MLKTWQKKWLCLGLQQLIGALISTLYSGRVRLGLGLHAADQLILCLDLVAHVDGHVPQIADHAAHLDQVLVHLVLARVISYAVNEALALRARVADDAARAVGVQLAVLVLLPGLVILLALLEALGFLPGQHAQAAALLQALQILLGLLHLLVDLVRAVLDPVELLALLVQQHEGLQACLLALVEHLHHAASALKGLERKFKEN